MINVTKENFNETIENGLVLVDFYADWCGPCKMISPILAEISEEMKDEVKIIKVNVDEQSELAQRFDIMSIPTMLLFKNGTLSGRKIGFLPKPEIIKFIKSAK